MKNIVFTIETSYSQEKYFLTVDENESITLQIWDAMAKICFCDAFEIIDYKEVSTEYVEERNVLISEYEAKYEPVEEAFCSGFMVTLDALKRDIEWRKGK